MQAATHSVTLNVGGKRFHTTKSTLSKSPFFKAMLKTPSGKGTQATSDVPFIDRDADAFKHILSLLRDPMYPFPEGLEHELNFFGIQPLSPSKFLDAPESTPPFVVEKYILFDDLMKLPLDIAKSTAGPIQLVPMSSPLPLCGYEPKTVGKIWGAELLCIAPPHLTNAIKACGFPMELQTHTKILCDGGTRLFLQETQNGNVKIPRLNCLVFNEMWQEREQKGVYLSVVPVLKSLSNNCCAALLVVTNFDGHKFQ